MNTNYTDEQIQTAIDEAFPQAGPSFLANLDTLPDTHCWPAEAPNRLAIARAFLAALSKPPTPPTGHRWHREDWTQEMLPEGYRPLLKDEPWLHGDEILRYNEWQVAGQHEDDAIGSPTTKQKNHCRTRRPLPAQVNAEPTESWANADNAKAFQEFQAEIEAVWEGKPTDGPPWIPHDGGPCPLKDDEVEEWEVRYVTGVSARWAFPISQGGWECPPTEGYTHYRVHKWKPGHGPQAAQYHMPKLPNPLAPLWTPKPGDVVRLKSGGQNMTVELVNDPGIALCSWMTLAGNLETKRIATVMLTPAN